MSAETHYHIYHQPPNHQQPSHTNSYEGYYPPHQPYTDGSTSSAPREAPIPNGHRPHTPHQTQYASQPQPQPPQTQSQPPPPPPSQPVYSSYGSAPPSQYISPPQPQWTQEGWSQYNQTYQPPPPQHPDSMYSATPTQPVPRPDPQPNEQSRSFSTDSSGTPDHGERDPGYPPHQQPSSSANPPYMKRRSEVESPAPMTLVTAVDFTKIMDIYRTIIDGAQSLSSVPLAIDSPRRAAEIDAIERMNHSAVVGAQMMESILKPPPTPSTLASANDDTVMKPVMSEPPPEEMKTEIPVPANPIPKVTGVDVKRQNGEETVAEGHTCLGCGATSTPEWRRGPMGPRTLCNACGLVYAKMIKKRARDNGRGTGKQQNSAAAQQNAGRDAGSSGESDDDGGSTGSMERD